MTSILTGMLAFAATIVLVWPVRRLALRLQIMDRPGPRKGHLAPVPYLGGLAILVGFGTAIVALRPDLWPVLTLMTFLAALGLIDDIRYLPVWVKLVGQVSVAASAVALGFSWHLTDSPAINAGLSIVWIVGLTNSFNLLDNMDGVASTVVAASLVALAVLVPSRSVLAVPLAGAALGFLIINRPPARMYMGDGGSLMLGFGVAICSIVAANSAHGLHSLVVLGFPVVVAVFDTSLVIASRLATGRPVQLGGQDHSTHRLKLLGWSPYQVLGTAILATAAGCCSAVLAFQYPRPQAWLALPIGVAFVGAWAGLLRVDPYASSVQRVEVYRGSAGL